MTERQPSAGYEAIADRFMAVRSATIGVATVREWVGTLPPGAHVLDIGCGHGLPITRTLVDAGLRVHAIEPSPTLAAAARENLPGCVVACESFERSDFFGRRFDGVLAVGLIFLLPVESQRSLISRVPSALVPGGSFLFSAPSQTGGWEDLLTGRESVSLGRETYVSLLETAGFALVAEYDDEGNAHYYHAVLGG